MARKIVELESLRGIAALSVVFTHIPPWNFDFYNVFFFRNSGEMVQFFFILSGFVIALNYGDRIRSLRDAARFQFLRFGRLYPIHLLFLLVVAGFELVKLLYLNDPVSPAFEPGVNGPREFVENLFLVQGLGFSAQPSSFNGPSWTISTEFYVYALFALVLLAVPARRRAVFLLLTAIAAAALIANPSPLSSFSRLILCICGFFGGCLVFEASRWLAGRGVIIPAYVAPLSFACLLIYLSVSLHRALWKSVVTFVLSAAIVVSVSNGADGAFTRALRWPPLAWLGMVSYTLYMAHYPVIHAFDVVMRRLLQVPVVIMYGQPVASLTPTETVVACGLLFAAILLVSTAAYYLVERPARRWSRRLCAADAPPHRASSVGSAA